MIRFISITIIALLIFSGCREQVESPHRVDTYPPIFPDYVGVTVPMTIAPLNFTVKTETFDKIDVKIKGQKSGEIHVQDTELAQFSEKDWHNLLETNKGSSIEVEVSLKSDGKWRTYKTFEIYVNETPIDHGLVYRMIAPGYEVYSKSEILFVHFNQQFHNMRCFVC